MGSTITDKSTYTEGEEIIVSFDYPSRKDSTLYWQIDSVYEEDFNSNDILGSHNGAISLDSNGEASITLSSINDSDYAEYSEFFEIHIHSNSNYPSTFPENANHSSFIGTSNSITLDDWNPNYLKVRRSTQRVSEGQLLLVSLSADNLPSQETLYWQIEQGYNGGEVDNNDFLITNGQVKLDKNNISEIIITPLSDGIEEDHEWFDLYIYLDEAKTDDITSRDFRISDFNESNNILTANNIDSLLINEKYNLYQIKDYDGNYHGLPSATTIDVISAYKYQGLIDINADGTKEAIYTNKESGRWVTASVDSVTGEIDYSDHGEGGTTRIVGIYDDPLIAEGEANNGFLSDGTTPAPANFGVSEEERYVEVNGERIDRLALNSQVRFQNDLESDNLSVKTSGDYDDDGVNEVYWKTNDGTAYLRALMHDDGNIRYANYQSEAQMTDYLTTQGHESVVDEIV